MCWVGSQNIKDNIRGSWYSQHGDDPGALNIEMTYHLATLLRLRPHVVQEAVSNEPRASTSGDAGTQQPAMTLEQFKLQLKELEKGLRSLPATAQVTLSPPPTPYLTCFLTLHTFAPAWPLIFET